MHTNAFLFCSVSSPRNNCCTELMNPVFISIIGWKKISETNDSSNSSSSLYLNMQFQASKSNAKSHKSFHRTITIHQYNNFLWLSKELVMVDRVSTTIHQMQNLFLVYLSIIKFFSLDSPFFHDQPIINRTAIKKSWLIVGTKQLYKFPFVYEMSDIFPRIRRVSCACTYRII